MTAINNKYSLSISHRELPSPLKTNVTLSHIFSYLEGRELARFSLVCRRWKKLIDQPELWQALLSNCFNFSGPLDPDLLKPAYRHNFLFLFLNILQAQQQAYAQSGDWRVRGVTTILPNGTCQYIIENTKNNISCLFQVKAALTYFQMEGDYVFAKCSNKIHFFNYKNHISSSDVTVTPYEITPHYEMPSNYRPFFVRNGFIILIHNDTSESHCELIPWEKQNRVHHLISAKRNFFNTADCLEVDNGWLYAFKGSKLLAWNLHKSRLQRKDAIIFKNIPFGHNGKLQFLFFKQGINYKNLIFSILQNSQNCHIIIRDQNLNNQVVKTFANCQTKDGTFNTTVFEILLRLCLIPRQITNNLSKK